MTVKQATPGPWADYASQKPEQVEAIYLWRVPSTSVAGLFVTFYAWMRTRGAGYHNTISPAFDYWDGYRLHVPKGTQWQKVDKCPDIKKYDFGEEMPEGVDVLPCPFCHKIPRWKAVATGGSRGVIIGGEPHRYDSWWLHCCQWATTPHMRDPRELSAKRNAMLTARTTNTKTEPLP